MILRLLVLSCLLVALRGAGAPPASSSRQTQQTLPVLDFPEAGLDDTAAYQGYRTRFYRDSKHNTVQIYLEPRGGRVVLVWADAANESAGFTARDMRGRPAPLLWDGLAAKVGDSAASRSLEYRLEADAPRIELGWFLLGSMRVERDFVYARRHLQPFTAPPFVVAEESLLVADVARLPAGERGRHLSLLRARSLADLRSRLQPTLGLTRSDTMWTVRVVRPSLDGCNHLALSLSGDPRQVDVRLTGRTVSLHARPGSPLRFRVRTLTDAAPLTPLSRDEIFTADFLRFLADTRTAKDSIGLARSRRLERQVKAVELLSTREKLMAGLPNFATYFGRDMMMTALMMRPIWSEAMSEHVIASVLRKLGTYGEVSHEEALGGQAIRENALVYDSLIGAYFDAARDGRSEMAESSLSLAGRVLRGLQATRENYHMIDDEFQLPVLVARYLSNPGVSPARKRAFLSDTLRGGATHLSLLLKELVLVADVTQPYADRPQPTNLVSFPKKDPTHWRSASWRDSDAGYAGGRFAMDVNAIWVPQALEAIATILATLPSLGFHSATLDSVAPGTERTVLGRYAQDSVSLRHAIETWKKAGQHFRVALAPRELRSRIRAKLAWLPEAERRYWGKIVSAQKTTDSLQYMALSLDSAGAPIKVVNTDPATRLFLENTTNEPIQPFMMPYPIGLFVDGLGPLVANDAYASKEIWERFQKDPYHGPRVVWGREVNLFLMGLANQISAAFDRAGRLKDPSLERYIRSLDDALRRTLAAVQASGLEHNELWSYRIEGGRLLPVRYGTSSDIQLWNTTNLVVQYVLSRLPQP